MHTYCTERFLLCAGEAAGDGGDTMNQLRAVVASVVADQERRSFVGAEKITPLLLWEKVGNHANVKFMEYNAVPVHRTTTAAGFHWDHGDQNTLRERCVCLWQLTMCPNLHNCEAGTCLCICCCLAIGLV